MTCRCRGLCAAECDKTVSELERERDLFTQWRDQTAAVHDNDPEVKEIREPLDEHAEQKWRGESTHRPTDGSSGMVITSDRETRNEFVLTTEIRGNSECERPARRGAFERHTSVIGSPIDKRSSLMGTPIPPTVYGTNAVSCQNPLWHVARACIRNGLADYVQV